MSIVISVVTVIIVVIIGIVNWAIQSFSSRLQRSCWLLSKAGGALGGGAVRVVEVGGGVVGRGTSGHGGIAEQVPWQNGKGHVQIIRENGVDDVVEVAGRAFRGGGKVRGMAGFFNDDRGCCIVVVSIVIVISIVVGVGNDIFNNKQKLLRKSF